MSEMKNVRGTSVGEKDGKLYYFKNGKWIAAVDEKGGDTPEPEVINDFEGLGVFVQQLENELIALGEGAELPSHDVTFKFDYANNTEEDLISNLFKSIDAETVNTLLHLQEFGYKFYMLSNFSVSYIFEYAEGGNWYQSTGAANFVGGLETDAETGDSRIATIFETPSDDSIELPDYVSGSLRIIIRPIENEGE